MAEVLLDCGCKAVVTHERGDRLIRCHRHLINHNVKADHTAALTYTATRIDPPDPEGPKAA